MNRVLFQADSSDTDYHERIFIKLTQHAERENSICTPYTRKRRDQVLGKIEFIVNVTRDMSRIEYAMY